MARYVNRTHVLIGGLGALLVAGALLGTTLVTHAQQNPTPTPGRGNEARGQRFDSFLGKLATNLGIDKQKLQDALVKSEQQMVDDVVKEGRLSADQGDRIKERIARNGGRPGFGPRAGVMLQRARMAVFGAAQKALGLSGDQLQTELNKGKSLNQIAQEQGKDPSQVKQQLVAALNTRLDEAVAAGRLPADRAATIKARIAEHADRLMSRTFGQRP